MQNQMSVIMGALQKVTLLFSRILGGSGRYRSWYKVTAYWSSSLL